MAGTLTEITLCRRLPDPDARTRASDFFLSCGFESHEITTTDLKALCKVSVYTGRLPKARKAQTAFKTAGLKGWQLRIRKMGEEDWLHKWKRHFRICPFGKKFAIVPFWQKDKYKGRRRQILIDPQAAFGSGTHETTRLMVKLMEPLGGQFKSFFDAGTGTGVLSVAASYLGAVKIDGVDLDSGSVKTAKLNMRLNKIRGASMRRSNLTRDRIGGTYDLVAANLISKTLVEAQAILGSAVKPGGFLIVSGISLKNLPGFLKEFRPRGIKRLKQIRGRSWGACLYRRLEGTQEKAPRDR